MKQHRLARGTGAAVVYGDHLNTVVGTAGDVGEGAAEAAAVAGTVAMATLSSHLVRECPLAAVPGHQGTVERAVHLHRHAHGDTRCCRDMKTSVGEDGDKKRVQIGLFYCICYRFSPRFW